MPVANPVSGFGYALKGLKLITRPGLRRWVAVPLLVNILLFSLLAWGGASLFEGLMDRYLPEEGWLSYFRWLLWPLFALSFILLMFYTFTLIANIVAAPFNDMLAAKVEILLSGAPPTEHEGSLLASIGPALASELRKAGYFLTRGVPLLLLFVIPGANLVAPLVWGIFSAWAIALEYTEYPFGNNGLQFPEQRRIMKQQRLPALGFGGGVMLMMLIPVLNFAAMPAAVAGATAYWIDHFKDRGENLTG
ncbi:MAG: sulfate transporter CysZ [Pseudomonadota bacterium]